MSDEDSLVDKQSEKLGLWKQTDLGSDFPSGETSDFYQDGGAPSFRSSILQLKILNVMQRTNIQRLWKVGWIRQAA